MGMQTVIQKLPEDVNHDRRHEGTNQQDDDGFDLRSVRLDFSKFDGEDPVVWLYKARQFFSFYHTQPQDKLLLASYYMEGKALVWFQELENFGTLVN